MAEDGKVPGCFDEEKWKCSLELSICNSELPHPASERWAWSAFGIISSHLRVIKVVSRHARHQPLDDHMFPSEMT
jgi:hypothetical protein